MIDELIAGIVLFKNFILLTLAAGIIGSLLAVIGTRKFSWNGRARGVYGFLINRSDREAVCFAVSLLGFLFVLSSVIFRVEMELPHLVFLFLLAAAKAVAGGGGRVFLRNSHERQNKIREKRQRIPGPALKPRDHGCSPCDRCPGPDL